MERIRRTCRWCGHEFGRLFKMNLCRHERAHVDESNPNT
jgi:ribosomal protein S14